MIIIIVLGNFYERLAYKLTEWGKEFFSGNQFLILELIRFEKIKEMHKTQTEFENQLTFKIFVFQ